MKTNGGYQVVDMQHIALTIGGDAKVIPGILDSINGANSKPIMVSNMALEGVNYGSFYPMYYTEDSKVHMITQVADIVVDLTNGNTTAKSLS